VALEALGFSVLRDVAPGEAVSRPDRSLPRAQAPTTQCSRPAFRIRFTPPVLIR
jgi:hypothetical protein